MIAKTYTLETVYTYKSTASWANNKKTYIIKLEPGYSMMKKNLFRESGKFYFDEHYIDI